MGGSYRGDGTPTAGEKLPSSSDLDASVAAAAASAVAASDSASAASTSESNAATSESNAATSESNAATSESNAATSESNASTSASNASTSETNAANSASAASTSETNAAASAAAAAQDEIDTAALLAAANIPSSLAGQGLKFLRVNAGETAYEQFNLLGTVNSWTAGQQLRTGIQADGSFVPGFGKGIELASDTSTDAYMQAYNRDTSAYQNLTIFGNTINVSPQGAGTFQYSGTEVAVVGHAHTLSDISDSGTLAALNTINNDNWSGTDLSVLNGGTGRSGNNPYLLMAAGSTSTAALVGIGAGTSGHVLRSNGTTTWPSYTNSLSSMFLSNTTLNGTLAGTAIDTSVTTSTTKVPHSNAVKTYVDNATSGVVNSATSGLLTVSTTYGVASFTHGLGATPTMLTIWLQCVGAEHNYSVGDRIPMPAPEQSSGGTYRQCWAVADSTTVKVTVKGSLFYYDKTGGGQVTLTLSNWRWVITAAV